MVPPAQDPCRRWEEALAQARADAAARGALLEAYRPRLAQLAALKLQGRVTVRVEPADVVQETFLQAYRHFDQFIAGDEPTFRAWLDRILENAVARALRNHLLLQKRSLTREQPLAPPGAASSAPGVQLDGGLTTPSQKAMRHEDEARLALALEQLPEGQRTAVSLRHLHNWSLAAIAEHLGRSPVATAALIKRGMEALRKQLGESTAP